MKSLFVTICMAVISATAPAMAQQASRPPLAENMQSLHMNSRYVNKVHVKAMRDFLQRNKAIDNVDWMLVDNGFVAKYTDESNTRCRTVYSGRGAFVYTIRQYYESNLPRDIRGIVKSVYYDYTITLVDEIIELARPVVYIVHLEDAVSLKNVRVTERDMEVIEEYKKPGR